MGDVNIIEGKVVESGPDGVCLAAEAIGVAIHTAPAEDAVAGMTGCAAVRPEKIAIAPAGDAPLAATNALRGVIYDYAYLGEYTLFRVRTESGHLIEASRLNRRREDTQPLTCDDPVVLSFEAGDAVFLDR